MKPQHLGGADIFEIACQYETWKSSLHECLWVKWNLRTRLWISKYFCWRFCHIVTRKPKLLSLICKFKAYHGLQLPFFYHVSCVLMTEMITLNWVSIRKNHTSRSDLGRLNVCAFSHILVSVTDMCNIFTLPHLWMCIVLYRTWFSNYGTVNILVKAGWSRVVHWLCQPYTALCNYNLITVLLDISG